LPAFSIGLPGLVTDLSVGAGYVVVTFGLLKSSNVELTGLLTTSAVVSAVLALSLQSTLGNVIGGVAMQLDGSIHAGDWIQLENGRQGLVKQIRWRHTVLETRDWGTLIVPNATLLSSQILVLQRRLPLPALAGVHRRDRGPASLADPERSGRAEAALHQHGFREPRPR
jgi:small-conductance mechanosensitive channel